MDDYTLLHGDCLEAMAAMDAGSVDAVVTDPPYHLTQASRNGSPRQNDPATPFGRTRLGSAGFMGKTWDGGDIATTPEVWVEALRVLKPSHYLMAFGGTRTWHRLACAIEDAGFEIRDTLMWLYGSGFPKGKSCLKPAWEPIILARKPGPMRALGIEECRVTHNEECRMLPDQYGDKPGNFYRQGGRHGETLELKPSGRWPANLILECTCDETREGTVPSTGVGAVKHKAGQDGAAYGADQRPAGTQMTCYGDANGKEPVRIHTDPNCPCAMLDGQTGTLTSGKMVGRYKGSGATGIYGDYGESDKDTYGDSGGASRFFYCSKASRSERNAGCEGLEPKVKDADYRQPTGDPLVDRIHGCGVKATNHHPTVKPLALMRWLVKLVARPGDVVLDPFMGSGTTGVACAMEGRKFIGIEQDAEYVEISRRRIDHASAQGRLPLDESPPLAPVVGRPT